MDAEGMTELKEALKKKTITDQSPALGAQPHEFGFRVNINELIWLEVKSNSHELVKLLKDTLGDKQL